MNSKPLLAFVTLVAAITLCDSVRPAAQSGPAIQFTTHHDYPAGYGPMSIAVGDLDGDGRPDLAVADESDDTVAVLIGKADGSFQPPKSIYLGASAGPRSIGIADFDRDGRADLAVANGKSATISILAGNGDGTFRPALALPAGTSPTSLAIADVNGDGRADLAVANGRSNMVDVRLGNGDGTFQPAQSAVSGAAPSFVAAADFNRDGHADLVVVNSGDGTIAILAGHGDGTFAPPSTLTVAGGASSLTVADVNGDGLPDLAVAGCGTNTVSVLAGNGDGTFRAPAVFDAGPAPTAVIAGDFNGDGRMDLAVANDRSATMAGAAAVSVLAANGDGTFGAPQPFAIGSVSFALAAGDFNGDAAIDLAVANSYSTTVSVLLGTNDGRFPAPLALPAGRNPEGLAAADVNGDGRMDLVVSSAGSDSVSVLIGSGDGTFQPPLTFAAGPVPVFVAVGDFNRDGRPDLVVANYGASDYYSATVASTVSVLLGNGDGTFQPRQAFEAGAGPHGIAIGDFNRDGIPDLAAADLGPYPARAATVAVLIGVGDGTFRPPLTFDAGHALTGVVVGDFNRDGAPDLALSSGDDATASVLLGNGDGTFGPKLSLAAGSAPKSVAADDFNGDGLVDLAVADHWSDTVSVFAGNGDGTFLPRVAVETGRNPAWIAVSDFDGDGVPDLAVANWFATTVSLLKGNGDGTFSTQAPLGAGAAPEKVVAADFNGDGQPDLAVADYFGGSVSIILNATHTARVATPVFSLAAGTYAGTQTVSITTGTATATIRVTTDGSAPTPVSPVSTGPLLIAKTTVLRAIATADGMTPSAIADASYVIRALPPAFSPPAGTYLESVAVTLASGTASATVRYTTDGTAPTPSSSVYSAPVVVTRNTTIRAIAAASGMAVSDEAAGTYRVTAAAPAFDPPAATYNQAQTVAIHSTTAGATIHYTTDGGAPSSASLAYTGPLSVTRTMTVRAIATADGLDDSAEARAVYTLRAATPTFDPPAGNYLLPQLVEIACASPGATIYYTTDGSAPTTSSSRYTGKILVLTTTTVRAIAVVPGWSPSAVASAGYTVLIQ